MLQKDNGNIQKYWTGAPHVVWIQTDISYELCKLYHVAPLILICLGAVFLFVVTGADAIMSMMTGGVVRGLVSQEYMNQHALVAIHNATSDGPYTVTQVTSALCFTIGIIQVGFQVYFHRNRSFSLFMLSMIVQRCATERKIEPPTRTLISAYLWCPNVYTLTLTALYGFSSFYQNDR